MIRRFFVKLHLWAGLAAGLFLVIAGLSGSVLAFGEEIDHALNPALWRATASAPRISIQEAADAAAASRPGERITWVRLPRAPDEALEIGTSRQMLVYVDPHGGKVLGARAREAAFVQRVHALHTKLLAGAIGHTAVGVSTSVLLFLLCTGLYLWWPKRGKLRQSFTIRWRSPWKRLTYDLHNVIGFYAIGVLFVITSTGVLLAWDGVTYPLIDRLTGTPPRADPPRAAASAASIPPIPLVPLDKAIAIADQALPDAPSQAIFLPAGQEGSYAIYKRYPEDRTPNGRSRVHVDPGTGTVLAVESTRTAPLGTRIKNQLRPLHTGDILGTARVLYALGSAWVAGLFVTGFLIWWGRRRGQGVDPGRAAP